MIQANYAKSGAIHLFPLQHPRRSNPRYPRPGYDSTLTLRGQVNPKFIDPRRQIRKLRQVSRPKHLRRKYPFLLPHQVKRHHVRRGRQELRPHLDNRSQRLAKMIHIGRPPGVRNESDVGHLFHGHKGNRIFQHPPIGHPVKKLHRSHEPIQDELQNKLLRRRLQLHPPKFLRLKDHVLLVPGRLGPKSPKLMIFAVRPGGILNDVIPTSQINPRTPRRSEPELADRLGEPERNRPVAPPPRRLADRQLVRILFLLHVPVRPKRHPPCPIPEPCPVLAIANREPFRHPIFPGLNHVLRPLSPPSRLNHRETTQENHHKETLLHRHPYQIIHHQSAIMDPPRRRPEDEPNRRVRYRATHHAIQADSSQPPESTTERSRESRNRRSPRPLPADSPPIPRFGRSCSATPQSLRNQLGYLRSHRPRSARSARPSCLDTTVATLDTGQF